MEILVTCHRPTQHDNKPIPVDSYTARGKDSATDEAVTSWKAHSVRWKSSRDGRVGCRYAGWSEDIQDPGMHAYKVRAHLHGHTSSEANSSLVR